jgi:CubicO group peptidase (beta-lactamase class C family)
MKNGQTVGLSIGVFKDGQTYTYNFGTTERGKQCRPTRHTRYAIASITKTFTGTLLAQAVIEKRVKLDDDVRSYLDGNYPNLEYQGQPIRLWQLINHTSGLPNISSAETAALDVVQDNDIAKKAIKEAAFLERYTEKDFFQELHDVKLTRIPGVSFSYSNVAAQLLGLVLERVYGVPYEKLLRTKITGPLKMNDTKVALTPAEVTRLPKTYSAGGAFQWPLSTRFPAAGSLKSTAVDMLKYIAWELAERDKAVKLSHQSAGSTVWSGDGSYTVGLNWQIMRFPGQRKIFQDGNIPGFHSMCVLYPELNLGIIVLTNEAVGPKPSSLSPMIEQILTAIDPRVTSTP